eukprot:c22063_g1_i4 orf=308-1054(+)
MVAFRAPNVSCSLKKDAAVLQASTMEEIYDALACRLFSAADTIKPGLNKHIVGLAGPPGAGKSTVANEVVNRLNALWHNNNVGPGSHDIAISMPMDGFHLYKWQLDAMEDPIEAHARRGAPWTFDPVKLVNSLTTLRNQGWVYVPSFEHGVGDPQENCICVNQLHKVVVVEGNYLLLAEGYWKKLTFLFDERWFLEVDIDKAMKRVLKRHILTGSTPEQAQWRVEHNDRRNAELIATSKEHADLCAAL